MSGRFETKEQKLEWQRKLCARVDEHAEGLSEWERARVSEWVDQLHEGRPLSVKQADILKRLDEEKVE